MIRPTMPGDDRWWARIPDRFRGLVHQYFTDRQRKQEEHLRQVAAERRKREKEAADAVKAFQQRSSQ